MNQPHHLPRPASSRPTATGLLTAVPGLLGFIPESSLVLISMREQNRVHATMRYDLSLGSDGWPDDDLLAVLDRLGRIVAGQAPEFIVGAIADNRFSPRDERYHRVLATADGFFAAAGGIAHGFVVTEFEEHAPWELIWQGEGPSRVETGVGEAGRDVRGWPARRIAGTMGDPHIAPTAVRHAVDTGRRLLARRSEIAEMLAPLPHCESEDCAVTGPYRVRSRAETAITGFGDITDFVGITELDPVWGDRITRDRRALLATVMGVLRSRPRLDCPTVSELELAITTPAVRDALLACAVTDLRMDAEWLWRMLTRRLTGHGRAQAATLLGHLYYIAGEGSYAGVTIDIAREADPHARLAELLDSALRSGEHPQMLWEMISESRAAAAALGVELPAITLDRTA
ncbi:DUF4192 domain-containing protein [Gordonia desulfuricans]|uniref:DUF4192 domain-containing protein n=1 Tax=Gordonia desulfuricans TaxID=89051 RepID=A0A7K3LPG1_9ACTN|nr:MULTISPECIES: DUF4192 domain-containing protein [Gordonia]EMP11633.2 hypothetical protein ISGA_4326 [Gordonia sp. NB41Y]NDK89427.1 DUF4192 domain-containing protein [Gordonia desulfuricans]WLP91087.1 DUF4192 domain-containing protein [Gordonia sp. NB41Y]